MTTTEALDRGRSAFDGGDWADAHARLSAADHASALEPEDLERLATAAYLVGHDAESAGLWERAHHELIRQGDEVRAVRCAFWLAFGLLGMGEAARAGGWFARARRLLDAGGHDCAERGYLIVVDAMRRAIEGDPVAGYALAGSAAEIGERFGDIDLITLARQIQGRVLIRQGKTTEGMALLDEMMVAVTAGEVSAVVAGDVYCSVIEACHEIFDVSRAKEWTEALTRWCESQPDLEPYRGQCLVHRAEIMQLHGAWADATEEALRACERFARRPADPAVGAAFYRLGELHRLCGRQAEAEDAYREASRRGREPQPGLALLRLAQGRIDAAMAAIRRVVDEARDLATRPIALAGHTEIMLAGGEVAAARAAADELSVIAADYGTSVLSAMAAHASGAVLLAEGDPRTALVALRRAWRIWQELEMPYEAARSRVLIGSACRELGDGDGAKLELDAAQGVFRHLGSLPDLARLEAMSGASKLVVRAAGGLTARETQVLALVATGRTNREIAAALVISEKTVARHVSNILGKLGLSSRAAATAYAYEHRLLQPQ